VVNFNWYECSSAFMQSQVAMYFDGVNFAGQFEDKEKSRANQIRQRRLARTAWREHPSAYATRAGDASCGPKKLRLETSRS